MCRRRRGRGAALILVLWLVAALALVVLAGAQGIRLQTQRMDIELERMRIEPLLDAAVQLSAQRLIIDPQAGSRYGLWDMQLGERTVRVELVPGGGLVDLNVASDALLQALLEKIGGLRPGDASILVSRIRDFIDPDDEPGGAGGAEAAQYRAAGWPVLPRNAPLDDLSELRMVLGVTPELYGIISPYLGIDGQQRIAIDSAPPALIDALSGQPGLGARIHSSAPETTMAGLLPGGPAAEYFMPTSGGGSAVRVRAYTITGEGKGWQREAWIEPRGRPDSLTPWTTLSLEATRRMDSSSQEYRP